MNSLRFLHLLLGQVALVAGFIGSLPFFLQSGPIDLAALLLMFFGLLNLQRFGSLRLPKATVRSALLTTASILLLLATLVPLTALLITPAALGFVVYAVGVVIAAVCLAAVVEMLGWLPAPTGRVTGRTDVGREAGTVKWFNTTKGFGFISRDQGDDIFVHFRGIRGDGHRVLLEGQRVEFVVAQREKGPQAEDVTILN